MNEFEADFDGERAIWKEAWSPVQQHRHQLPPEGELEKSITTWRKVHLVLFGEYIPLLSTNSLSSPSCSSFPPAAEYAGNFDAGTSARAHDSPRR